MILQFDPNIVGKKKLVKEVIHETYTTIYHKIDCKAIFYATTRVKPSPKPITNMEQAFPAKIAELKDFFQLTQIRSGK